MITRTSFDVFNDPTLSGRLAKIQTEVDPDFEILGEHLTQLLYPELHQKLKVHLAKHLRRHKNPPVDTWLALSSNSRGYKMMPHFEVGLWPDKLFITLALLSDMKNRDQVAASLSELDWQIIPAFHISTNHASSDSQEYSQETWETAVEKFQQDPKSDFVLGMWIAKDDPQFADPQLIEQLIQNQIIDLAPLYQELMRVYNEA
ncbi:DUF1054 family protein [Lapidilactobacillus bayanensis]|uniref:DUF1054 family protein n=1 Tax=Lapidilactobacillus bayanensis TaxID=2485998 RepID=UPI0013DD87AF|nr:DUF1054 family protein [Lapidilactobacillus bayanensis]